MKPHIPGIFLILLLILSTCLLTSCTDSEINDDSELKPEVSFTYQIDGRTVVFTNTSKGTNITFLWNFGDGSSSTIESPTHIYEADGQYMVSLTVANAFDTVAAQSVLEVGIEAPEASFTFEMNGRNVTFTNTSTGENVSYIWDFGDEVSSTSESPSHTYDANGTYLVKLIATNEGGRDSSQVTLEITNISIDGDLSDWEDVPALVEERDGVGGGFLTKLKVENLNNEKLFVYVETNSEMIPLNADEGTVIQLFLDVDNDPSTGADVCWLYNEAGEDFLFEGTFLGSEGTLFLLQDNGVSGCGWNWTTEPISNTKEEYMVASELVTLSGGFAYELSIDLSALPLTVGGAGVSNEAIRIGVHHLYQWGIHSLIPEATYETGCVGCTLATYTF